MDGVDRFEELVSPLLDTAYRVALRLTHNPEDASDLVQEAVLRAIKGFHTYSEGTNFRAWFLKILTNVHFRNRERLSAQTESVSIDEAPELVLFQHSKDRGLLDASEDPAAALMESVTSEAIVQAIDELPEEYKLTLTLYVLNDLPYEEIARIVETPVGTIRSRIHRGKNILQRKLNFLLEKEQVAG